MKKAFPFVLVGMHVGAIGAGSWVLAVMTTFA